MTNDRFPITISKKDISYLLDKILYDGFVYADISIYMKNKYGVGMSGRSIVNYIDELIGLEDLDLNDLIGIKYKI